MINILLLGGGGREHALAWKISQSPKCNHLYIAPGNAGTAHHGTNIQLNPLEFEALYQIIQEHHISLVVVGPEEPLVHGITDFLQEKGIAVVGPSQAAARLEGSKAYAKDFMAEQGILTAASRTFHKGELAHAQAYLANHPLPVVIKASGLAAGKGVLICESRDQALAAVADMLTGNSFGRSGETVVIEQFLRGKEVSIFVLTDGKSYLTLPSAKDYKRIGEGDKGLNTGGMGAVSPVPFLDEALMSQIDRQIIQPTLAGIQQRQLDYRGFIFIGLMIDQGTPYVLEYNVRMGDPETEVVIPRLKTDLVDLLQATAEQRLAGINLEIEPQTCTTVMLVSGGYPQTYEKGKPLSGFAEVKDAILFHAGTRLAEDKVLTNGGRVIAASAFGANVQEAVAKSLAAAETIQFEGKYFRSDIGKDVM